MPCENCPIGLGCPGENHARYCELRQADPVGWDRALKTIKRLNPDLPVNPTTTPIAPPTRIKTSVPPHGLFASSPVGGKVRLGFISPHLLAGGAESVQMQLLRGLDQSQFTFVGLVCIDQMGDTDSEVVAKTNEFIPIQFGKTQIATLAAQCDVLLNWMIEDLSQWMGGSSTPIVFVDHFAKTGPITGLADWCLRGGTQQRNSPAAIVGVSPTCAPGWTDNFYLPKYQTIPNAIDTTRLAITRTKAEMMALWGVPGTTVLGVTTYPPVVGSYCRYSLERRPEAVVRSITALPPNVYVVLVGPQHNADEVAYVNQVRNQLPPSQRSRVHLVGEDANSGDVLSNFDVLVSAPATESFGLSITEAMRLGVPVVATLNGIAQLHPEFVYPVAVDDTPSNLASAITAAMLGGPRPGAQAFVKANFTSSAFISTWTALLVQVANSNAKPGMMQMAGNFAKAIVKHAANGFAQASEQVQRQRIETCHQCPDYLSETEQCRLCGCLCNVKKSWASEQCPMRRWPA